MKCYSFDGGPGERSVPAFRLPAARGEALALSDYQGQANLVLVFSPDGDCWPCEEGLRGFAIRQGRYRAHGAEVWALLPDPVEEIDAIQDRLAAPFPRLLADQEGKTREAYLTLLPEAPCEDDMLLFVLDRLGAPRAAFVAGQLDDLVMHEQLLDLLAGVECECG